MIKYFIIDRAMGPLTKYNMWYKPNFDELLKPHSYAYYGSLMMIAQEFASTVFTRWHAKYLQSNGP